MQKDSAPLTSLEAAEVLDVSYSTISRMVADGRIKPLKKLPGLRGAHLFAASEVERVRQERTAASA